MIVQVRGTSGCGKTTVVKGLIDEASTQIKFRGDGRRQPLGYLLHFPPSLTTATVAIPGHYESACGGCDTLPGQDATFELVRKARDTTDRVIFEGLLASEEVNRTLVLHDDFPGELTVILLTTPVEDCLDSIRQRRVARGDDRPLKEDNTRNRVRTIEKACARLEAGGVTVVRTDRRGAAQLVRELLW